MDLFIYHFNYYTAIRSDVVKGNIGIISKVRSRASGRTCCYFNISNKGMQTQLGSSFIRHVSYKKQQSGSAQSGFGIGYVGYIEFDDEKSAIKWLKNEGFVIKYGLPTPGKNKVKNAMKRIPAKDFEITNGLDVNQIPSFFCSNSNAVQLALQIINIFKELGFQMHRPKCPKIILADDPPEEEKCRFDGFPERIDGVCGLYCDSTQTITLFCNPIAATANSIRVPFSVAMAVVLAHELTHWITYRFSHPKSKPNKTAFKRYGLGQVDFEGKSVTEVVEGIAELATFCAIRKTKDDCLRKEMLHYFKKMHEKLCSDYRAFDIYFEFWPLEYVVSHLVRLARRNDPSASTLKSNKNPDDSPYFEYHWHGCFEYENSKASPWTLSYSEGPAVLINLYPFDKGFPNQMKHDESGWYNWPSAAIFSKPNHSIYGRPNEMNLHRVFLELGNLKSPSSGGPAMVYISHSRPYLRFSEWEPDNQHGVLRRC